MGETLYWELRVEQWRNRAEEATARATALATEVERLKGALREVAFAGCRHVWDDDCARCHTFEPLKSVARLALSPSTDDQKGGE